MSIEPPFELPTVGLASAPAPPFVPSTAIAFQQSSNSAAEATTMRRRSRLAAPARSRRPRCPWGGGRGLGAPTMENIAAFVWMRLAEMPSLHKVVIRRDSANEGCVYRGPVQDAKSPTP